MSSISFDSHHSEEGTRTTAKEAAVLPWSIIHCCEHVRDVMDVVESQLTVAMRPYLLTPTGGGSAAIFLRQPSSDPVEAASLMTAWNQVRDWRKSISPFESTGSFDLIHAHSFSSGMASVRSSINTVYDMEAFVEQIAVSQAHCEEKSWLARSFRVAEQFVLSRSSAIVVHSPYLKDACVERGASAESVFVIPAPLATETENVLPQSSSGCFTIFAPDIACASAHYEDSLAQAVNLLTAFQRVHAEFEQARFVLTPHPSQRALINQILQQLNIADCTTLLSSSEAAAENDHALRSADVVIAGAHARDAAHLAYADMFPSSTCLRAMAAGRAVLAADAQQNRNVSPEGRGLLWYSPESPRETANRLLFLAQNRDLWQALAHSAREFIAETRSATAVGCAYNEVYRYASQKSRDRHTQIRHPLSLEPALGEF